MECSPPLQRHGKDVLPAAMVLLYLGTCAICTLSIRLGASSLALYCSSWTLKLLCVHVLWVRLGPALRQVEVSDVPVDSRARGCAELAIERDWNSEFHLSGRMAGTSSQNAQGGH